MKLLNESEMELVAGADGCESLVLQVGIPAGVSVQGSFKDIGACLDSLFSAPDYSLDIIAPNEINAHEPNYGPAFNMMFGGRDTLQPEEYNEYC